MFSYEVQLRRRRGVEKTVCEGKQARLAGRDVQGLDLAHWTQGVLLA